MMTTIGSFFGIIGLEAAFPATFALEIVGSLAEAGLLAENTGTGCLAPGAGLGKNAERFAQVAPHHSPLAQLKARFDPAREYTPDEKLEMEVALFDVGDEIYREMAKRLRAYLKGAEDFNAIYSWGQEQGKWVVQVHEKLLQDVPPDYGVIFRGLYSSWYQSVASAGNTVFSLRERIFMKAPPAEIARWVELLFVGEVSEQVLVDGNGYRESHSRGELAGSFIGNFVYGVQPVWENNLLVVRHPVGKSPMGVTQHGTIRAIPWPLDFEDLTLKTVLKVLGWQITQEIDGDQVILRINFGTSTFITSPPSTS